MVEATGQAPSARGHVVSGTAIALTAALAPTPQQHVVTLDPDAEPIGEPADRAFETRIVERDEASALLADQVVMMGAVGVSPLEPGLPVTDLDALDEAVLREQLQHPVDARATGRAPVRPQRALDLDRTQRARLAREQLDHPFARPSAL